MSTRTPRTLIPLVVASAAMLVVGLVLGAGRDSEDASLANTASKLLLTVGLVALVASCTAEAIRRRRDRSGRTDVSQVP